MVDFLSGLSSVCFVLYIGSVCNQIIKQFMLPAEIFSTVNASHALLMRNVLSWLSWCSFSVLQLRIVCSLFFLVLFSEICKLHTNSHTHTHLGIKLNIRHAVARCSHCCHCCCSCRYWFLYILWVPMRVIRAPTIVRYLKRKIHTRVYRRISIPTYAYVSVCTYTYICMYICVHVLCIAY